ncbi:MAG: UDP-N-acetylglucosamine--N-acetylmuramyl-(pentapeptide) pyrophosphoryl-undecaprenol N-acetylglucosamine transferase [bacterium]|nr:UDP-N-acetylglucosamine--N-acetylmuramyl-(pentapeptide) pyrophosphoryl-undecaprenol N-acetylglucosamine transferase [bacterium]
MKEPACMPGPSGPGMQAGSVRLAIAGGGTGGHIVPGLHLLDHLRASPSLLTDLLWFTSGRAVEANVLAGLAARAPDARVEEVALSIEREGGGAPSPARLTLRLPPNVLRARAALRAHRSEVLLGLGGFVTAPAVLAARTLGIPVCLLEINASAGRATRTLAPLCARVLHAWDETLPAVDRRGERHKLVGPPLAPGFARRDASPTALAGAKQAIGFDPRLPLLVVLGGSQGARGLNDFVRASVVEWCERGIAVLHQVGPGRRAEGARESEHYRAVEYVADVRATLAAADLVLCRGGASTLAEVGAMGVPAWIVPYPHHADRHQERNARGLGDGVRVVPESELGPGLAEELMHLVSDAGAVERAKMGRALVGSVPSDAAASVVEELFAVRRTPAR